MTALVQVSSDLLLRPLPWRRYVGSLRRRFQKLPPLVAQLKDRIRKTQPKYFTFNLLKFRRITTPPVQIPFEYQLISESTTLVGGSYVPLTRFMWRRRQWEYPPTLSCIPEADETEIRSQSMDDRARFATHYALVGHSVRVYVRHDQTFLSGVLLGVDPESGDVALVHAPVTPSEAVDVKLIMGHAIDRIERDPLHSACTLQTIQSQLQIETTMDPTPSIETTGDRDTRLQRLYQLLEEHFIPYTPSNSSDSVDVLGGAATIRYPFDPQSIACSNEQILRRLQRLVENF